MYVLYVCKKLKKKIKLLHWNALIIFTHFAYDNGLIVKTNVLCVEKMFDYRQSLYIIKILIKIIIKIRNIIKKTSYLVR
jgi:hypothetical protein